ncbi:MAG TPA: hypothetical protein VGM88_15980 [Kofleriaceae bacterium]
MPAILLAIACATSVVAAAEPTSFVVIVNAHNPVRSLDKRTIANAFLKKERHWGDDSPILPVDQKPGASVRSRFTDAILDRPAASVRTYWSQLVFSGRGTPPPELDSDAAVIEYVGSHAGAIGYVSAGAALDPAKQVAAVQVK